MIGINILAASRQKDGDISVEIERKLLLFGLFGESGKIRLRDGNDLGEGVREPFKRRLTRLGGWGSLLRGLFGHVPLSDRCFLPEMPSASCTLAQGRKHV
jgi:hypothetical protein